MDLEKKQKYLTCIALLIIFSSFQLYNMYLVANPPEDLDATKPLNIRITLKHDNHITPVPSIESEIIIASDHDYYDTIILQRAGTDGNYIVYIGMSSKTITYAYRMQYGFQINNTGALYLNTISMEKSLPDNWGIYEGSITGWFQLPTTNETVECPLTFELGPRS